MALDYQALLVLPRVRIQNANAISSPLTWGFPAPSAFTGFMHALQRRISGEVDIEFGGIGVICHWFEPQVTTGGYTRAFRLTRNPVDKGGSTAAIVEEGRAHMDVTLVLGAKGQACLADDPDRAAIAQQIWDTATGMRIAGGSPIPSRSRYRPELTPVPEDAETYERKFRRWCRQWLPGFALVGRNDLLDSRLDVLQKQDPQTTRLDAWLDMSRLNHYAAEQPVEEESSGQPPEPKVTWEAEIKPGWIVPIPVGYAALSDVHSPGTVAGARDTETPFRFVESLYSLGQWISPHRLQTLDELFWYHSADPEHGLYLCRNDYADLN